jgi:hypothetical protein
MLADLSRNVSRRIQASARPPKTAGAFGGELRRISPQLRTRGIAFLRAGGSIGLVEGAGSTHNHGGLACSVMIAVSVATRPGGVLQVGESGRGALECS